MDTPAGSGRQPARKGQGPGGRRSGVLGSLTIPGGPQHVAGARKFIARTVCLIPGIDCDAATLMTSELVTNAIQHTRSGDGGEVTVTVIGLPDGVLVEVTDQGSAQAPVVRNDLYTAAGHGLYLVQQFAAQWGYLRAPAGSTVWFHLTADGDAGVSEPGTGTRARPRSSPVANPLRQRLRPALS